MKEKLKFTLEIGVLIISFVLIYYIPKNIKPIFTAISVGFLVLAGLLICYVERKMEKVVDWKFTRKWVAILGILTIIDISVTAYFFFENPDKINYETNPIPIFFYNHFGLVGMIAFGILINLTVITIFTSIISVSKQRYMIWMVAGLIIFAIIINISVL